MVQGKLTLKLVRAITEPGFYGDGNTLFLRVAPGGSKQWVQRLTVHGRRRSIGLGGVSYVTLAEAREAALENRRVARRGGDPLAEKRRANALRFREAAQNTWESLRPRWRNAKVAANWLQQLERHAMKRLGDLPVNQIDREDVLAVLTPIWGRKQETARRVRRYIRTTLDWCLAHGFVETNVAGDSINGALPRMASVKAHYKALPYGEVSEVLQAVEASGASSTVRLALTFLIYTTARSGEVRGAVWSEIDTGKRVWKIPGERMKAGAEHRVPLSAPAVRIIKRAKKLHKGSELVFPSPIRRDRPISDATLSKLLRSTGVAGQATVHGFRSTFRDWCADTGKPRELAEAALAHAVGGVEGAYFRSDLFERRRELMDDWAEYLAPKDEPTG